MSVASAVEGFFTGLFAKAKTDIQSEIASPNWADIKTVLAVLLVALLIWNSKVLLFNEVSEGYIVHTVWVLIAAHTVFKLGIAFLNAWKGTTAHSNATAVAVAATTPGVQAPIVTTPATLPAKSS